MKPIFAAAAATATAAGVCLLRSEYEKNHLATEVFTIHSPKIHGNGKRFLFLSDLHNKEFGEGNEKLLQAVRDAKPDAILVGGDMMICKGKPGISVPLALLEALAAEFPVYHADGNHETRMEREKAVYGDQYQTYMDALKQMGVYCLHDEQITVGDDFVIAGLNLPESLYRPGYPKMEPGFPERKLGKSDKEKFTILLAHSPMFFDAYARWGADLTLSGHFHGGTIRLPFLGGVMTPQYQFFYPWCAGMFEKYGKKMLVSRGLGTHSINVRLFNRPQVVVADIGK